MEQGVSVSRLADLFRLNRRTVTKRIKDVQPCGEERGNAVYAIYDVAPFLVDMPEVDIDPMSDPDHMPPDMRKDHYDAELKKQKHELLSGDLWETQEVFTVFATAFNRVQLGYRLLPERLIREAGIDQKTADAAAIICDAELDNLRELLIKYPDDDELPER